MDSPTRKVILREERRGNDTRSLWAHLDAAGNLHVDGQDLGPGTGMVSGDGEYEWFQTIPAAHVPTLLELLGAPANANPLDVLEERCVKDAAVGLEKLLRSGKFPVERSVWSG